MPRVRAWYRRLWSRVNDWLLRDSDEWSQHHP